MCAHVCTGAVDGRAEVDGAVSSLTAPMSQLSTYVSFLNVSAEGQTRVLTLARDIHFTNQVIFLDPALLSADSLT